MSDEGEPKNWIVYGQENHPDRFVTDDFYGPYTEAEANEKAAAWNEAPTNYSHGHKLYNWRAVELTL